MKNKHFNLTSGIVLILIPLVFSFTGCKDDYETYYEGYGLVSKSGDEKFTVKLDDGYLLYPREYYFNPEKLNDSTRLRIRFNILEEQDTNLYARIVYADTILTKSILPYDETILDSVGNAPVKIVNVCCPSASQYRQNTYGKFITMPHRRRPPHLRIPAQ